MRLRHTDLAGSGSAEAASQTNYAYEVLSDPIQRAAYDARLGLGLPSWTTGPRRTAFDDVPLSAVADSLEGVVQPAPVMAKIGLGLMGAYLVLTTLAIVSLAVGGFIEAGDRPFAWALIAFSFIGLFIAFIVSICPTHNLVPQTVAGALGATCLLGVVEPISFAHQEAFDGIWFHAVVIAPWLLIAGSFLIPIAYLPRQREARLAR